MHRGCASSRRSSPETALIAGSILQRRFDDALADTDTALTLEPVDEPMDPHATQAESESPRGGPLKFTYANGARPLAGYTIKRGIGRGGFGEVYFAVSDGGKEVALKLIRHNLDVELRGVTHCLNLKHPNLIALYDVKQDEQGNSWVVMEYVAGESLEEVIRRNPDGLPPEEAIDWMQGIAAGVGYLHDHGIVHRDLKPGNIFRDDGQVKLGDYGLSKFISCSRRSGQTESIGTVHYMAPEVANGRYGKEIDIYALGIILYEMLTGHVPFEGESVGEVLMKHLTAEPSLAEVPEAYRDVIGRALAKDPATRFASVGEMMDALAAAGGDDRPIGRRWQKRAPPASRSRGRRVLRAAAAASAAAAADRPPLPPARPRWPRRRGRRRADLAGHSRRLAQCARSLGRLEHARQDRSWPCWAARRWPTTPHCFLQIVRRWSFAVRDLSHRPLGRLAARRRAARRRRPDRAPRSRSAVGRRRVRPRPHDRRASARRAALGRHSTDGLSAARPARRRHRGRLAQGIAAALEAPLGQALARTGRGGAGRQVAARTRGRPGRFDDPGRRDRRRHEPRGRGCCAAIRSSTNSTPG